jgi:hypothetical protein
MAIEQQSRFEPATVLYFDSRRGTGRCLTRAGRLCRIPLGAVNEANITALDEGAEIFVAIDEYNPCRIDRLRLPEPAVVPEPTPKPFNPPAPPKHKSRSVRKR